MAENALIEGRQVTARAQTALQAYIGLIRGMQSNLLDLNLPKQIQICSEQSG